MPVRVQIPTPMRTHTDGQATVKVDGATVQAVLDGLGTRCPGISQRILENGPGLRSTSAPSTDVGTDEPYRAETFEDFKERSEALFFRLKLAENEGNVKRTAERLGMQRSHLYKKLERFHLK